MKIPLFRLEVLLPFLVFYRDRVFWLAVDSSIAGASLESLVRSVTGKAGGP